MAKAEQLVALARAGLKRDHDAFMMAVNEVIVQERKAGHHGVVADLQNLVRRTPGRLRPIELPQKTDGLQALEPRYRLADMGLPAAVEETCAELVEEHGKRELLATHGLEPRNRLLMYGPPGNGKTMLAEALANELDLPFYLVDYARLFESHLGATAKHLAEIFRFVAAHPGVLFFDEFDAVSRDRGDAHDVGEMKRVVNSLLIGLDKLPSEVVLIGATNHLEAVDGAAWRRFNAHLELPAPSREAAAAWYGRRASELGIPHHIDANAVIDALPVISYSAVEGLCLDIRRRLVLSESADTDVHAIVSRALSRQQAAPRRVAGIATA